MSNSTPRLGFNLIRALAWGSIWSVAITVIEGLAISPAGAWGSPQQMLFWLIDWCTPGWCVVGALLVALAERSERSTGRWNLILGFALLSLLAAVIQTLAGAEARHLTQGMVPSLEQYLRDAGIAAPLRENWANLAIYLWWVILFYGGLLVVTCKLTLRAERSRRLLHQSAMARSRTQALLDTERLQALQQQIDPELLLDSMQELKLRYRADPESAERLLEALVEFMRSAMHGLRTSVSTVREELQLARAFAQLQQQRGLRGAWRVLDEPPPDRLESYKFPSLLMLPLLALSGEEGRPLLKIRRHETHVTLSLNGLSQSVSSELGQQIRSRLRALYGEGFTIDAESLTQQLTITLQQTHPQKGANHVGLVGR